MYIPDKNFKKLRITIKKEKAVTSVAQLVGRHPAKGKVAGSG